MVTWTELADKYPEASNAIVEHLKGNATFKQIIIGMTHKEIGAMSMLMNTTKNVELKQWASFFITLLTSEVENLTKGVENDRRTIAEITGV